MATRIYGSSDDIVVLEGDIEEEYGSYGTDEREKGVLVACSDGTVLEVKYGKGGRGVWGVTLLRRGNKFDRIDQCVDEDAKPHSDVAYFHDGLSWAYAADRWEALA